MTHRLDHVVEPTEQEEFASYAPLQQVLAGLRAGANHGQGYLLGHPADPLTYTGRPGSLELT